MAAAKRECHAEWEQDWDEGTAERLSMFACYFFNARWFHHYRKDEEGWYSLRVWHEENREYEEGQIQCH